MPAKGLRRRAPAKRPKRRQAVRVGATRASATKVLAQGALSAPRQALGADPYYIRGLDHRRCWDAFNQAHAPLPRAVGPYCVVRTTQQITTSDEMIIFGTFQDQSASGSRWRGVCAVSQAGAAATGPISSTSATNFWAAPAPGSRTDANSTFTCCPSAISVQAMCPVALQNANGLMYAAVAPAQYKLGGSTYTWPDVRSKMLSFFRPRILTAGKLALRGIQMDSMPLSMSQVSEFLEYSPSASSGPSTWPDGVEPIGWAPLLFANPSGEEMQYFVTIEWRVRFDISNPAVSAHQHHGVSSDAEWDHMIRRATAALPGVIDIVSKVADIGVAGVQGVAAIRGAAVAGALL